MTWGDGTTGVTGTISAANSLIGGWAERRAHGDATPNSNYVVSNRQWNGGLGEVTWASGTAGVDGSVSAANSLVGSDVGDGVGDNVIPLTNGNYVVDSRQWNGAFGALGAVTWGSGTMGVSGTISVTNSLIGNSSGDEIGGWYVNTSPFTGVIALTNGNYVVDSPGWNGGVGAVTWGNGTTGTAGTVSAANSLVGSNQGDAVVPAHLTIPPSTASPSASPPLLMATTSWTARTGITTKGRQRGTTGDRDHRNGLLSQQPGRQPSVQHKRHSAIRSAARASPPWPMATTWWTARAGMPTRER